MARRCFLFRHAVIHIFHSLVITIHIAILSLKTKLYLMIMEIKDPGTADFASNLSLQDNIVL